MRCKDVQARMAEFAGEALRGAEQTALDRHLAGCPECRDELEGLERSLRALEAAAPGPAPDLWAGFSARLAAETPCAEVSALLPEYLAGELAGTRSWSIAGHLEACAACAREVALYERAEQALVRAAREADAPDLWPAFAARLDLERSAPSWKRALTTAAAAWASLWAQPAARPAFAAGLAALALFAVAPRLQQRPEPEATGTLQARLITPEPTVRPEPAAPGTVKPAPPRRTARKLQRERPVVRRAPRRTPPRNVVQPAPEKVLVKAPATPETVEASAQRWPGLQVAFNPDLIVPAAAPVVETTAAPRSMSGDMERAVKRDFVEFAEVIEDIRDVATAPLEAGTDGE